MDPRRGNREDESEFQQFLENQLDKFLDEFDPSSEAFPQQSSTDNIISIEDHMQIASKNNTDTSYTQDEKVEQLHKTTSSDAHCTTSAEDIIQHTITRKHEIGLEDPPSTQNNFHSLLQDFELFEKTMLPQFSNTDSSKDAIKPTDTKDTKEHTISTNDENDLVVTQDTPNTFHSLLRDFELFEKTMLPPFEKKHTHAATDLNGSFTNYRNASHLGASGRGRVLVGSSTSNKVWVPIKIKGGINALKLVTTTPSNDRRSRRRKRRKFMRVNSSNTEEAHNLKCLTTQTREVAARSLAEKQADQVQRQAKLEKNESQRKSLPFIKSNLKTDLPCNRLKRTTSI